MSRSEVEQCCGEARLLRHGEHEALGNRVPLICGSIGAVAWIPEP